MENKINLGSLLKELRLNDRDDKLSQEKLAQILQTTQDTISLWELQKSYPNIFELKQIASFFNVSTDYLLGLTDDPTPYWISDTTYTSAEPAPNVYAYARGGTGAISAYVSPEDQKAAYDEAVRRRNENRKKKDPKE